MKRMAIQGILCFCLSVGNAFGQSIDGRRTIRVSGDAAVLIRPDEAWIDFGIETLYKELGESKAENDRIVKAVIAAIAEQGVPMERIKTEFMRIEPEYRHDSRRPEDYLGYRCRKTVLVTLSDLDKLEAVLTDALNAGATHVHGVEFRTTELHKHRDKARSVAINAAKDKAVALASELGMSIGSPISINEGYVGWRSWHGLSTWGGGRSHFQSQRMITASGVPPEDADTAIAPGQISVFAQIGVTFELIEPVAQDEIEEAGRNQ